MTPTHETLRGTWRDRINTQEIPPHPIESSAAYKEYLVKRTESVRYSLEKILRYTQHCPLAELTATAIDHALMKLELEGYRPTTRDKLRRAIVAFLKWANARGFVWKNVALDATDVDLRRELVEPKIVPDEIRNALDEYYRNPQNAYRLYKKEDLEKLLNNIKLA